MRFPTRPSHRLGGLLLIAALAACSGGGVNTTPATPTTNTTGSGTTSTTAAVPLPPVTTAGITTNVVLPAASIAGAKVALTTSVSAPSGISPLSKARSVAQSTRTTQSAPPPNPILYVQFTSDETVTLSGTPAISFILPTVDPNATYYLALDTAGGWTVPALGPATVSGTTVIFAQTSTQVTLTANVPTTLALYSLSAAPVATPNVLTFDATSPTLQSFTVAESGYTGTFTATMGVCTAATPPPEGSAATPTPVPTATGASPAPSPFIASVAPTPNTPGSFDVTSGSEAGQCFVTVSDSAGVTSQVEVDVDQAQIGIYSTHRTTR